MENCPSASAKALPIETIEPPKENIWSKLGFLPHSGQDRIVKGVVPDTVLILSAASPSDNSAVGEVCKQITNSQPFQFKVDERTHFAYRLDVAAKIPINHRLPSGINLLSCGDELALPGNLPAAKELPLLSQTDLSVLFMPRPEPVIKNSPLQEYSLKGRSGEFTQMAVNAVPLLGDLCLAGQATVWYAPPNAGKTLIALKLLNDAIAEQRIMPDNVWYLNADDSSEGFATKIGLMDDLGVNTLAPGFLGFDAKMLPNLFEQMAAKNKAKGSLVIIDTIKKVASLMDKNSVTAFTAACRTAVMAGATIVGFAHTNKQPTVSGKLQYGGTTDLRDDFDAAYIMGTVDCDWGSDEKVVQFSAIKSRGPNAQQVAYAYCETPDLSYAERLASVRLVEADEMNGFRRQEEVKADAEIINAVEACIIERDYAKIALSKAVAKRAGISERQAIHMIEKYSGTDPLTARWTFERKDRGAQIFKLLPSATEAPAAPS